jgi:hypothetical protein
MIKRENVFIAFVIFVLCIEAFSYVINADISYVKEKSDGIEEMSRTDRLYNALYHLESGEYKVSYNYFEYLYNEYEKESLEKNNELYSWNTTYVESEMALC